MFLIGLGIHIDSVPVASLSARDASPQDAIPTQTTSFMPSSTTVLNVFQVSTPVLGSDQIIRYAVMNNTSANTTFLDPTITGNCKVTLMDFSFANSFGNPFVGKNTVFFRSLLGTGF